MSDTLCHSRRMQSDETAEPLEWDLLELQRTLNEWGSLASQMMEHLLVEVHWERSANWKPHLHQLMQRIRHFRDRCREESRQLGHWRADGLQPDEVYELVWADADRLGQWLTRMMELDDDSAEA